MKSSILKYRPEVDGLRAIAVGAVIVYHSQIRILEKLLLPGGFLGVDIFFVISGYLITYLIFKEKVSTNNFSFKDFSKPHNNEYLIKARMKDIGSSQSALIFDDTNERLYPMRVRPRMTWHGGEAPNAMKNAQDEFKL